jgi:hypothetical protein
VFGSVRAVYYTGPLCTCPKEHVHGMKCTGSYPKRVLGDFRFTGPVHDPNETAGVSECRVVYRTVHVLFGTGAEWPSIIYCSDTPEHSFPLSSHMSRTCISFSVF